MNLFETIDKSGRAIYLTQERWNHIQKHPRMSGQIEQIKETLQHPDVIIPFEFESNIYFYYHYYKKNRDYLFISVKYLNGKGFIITSFYTDKIK